jgi:hypothetical protein
VAARSTYLGVLALQRRDAFTVARNGGPDGVSIHSKPPAAEEDPELRSAYGL